LPGVAVGASDQVGAPFGDEPDASSAADAARGERPAKKAVKIVRVMSRRVVRVRTIHFVASVSGDRTGADATAGAAPDGTAPVGRVGR
jgi:hypothetical protein